MLFALFVVFLIPFGVMGSSYIVDGLLETSSEPLLASLLLISGTAAHGLFLPLVGCTRVGIYVALRRRKEGYDLEQQTMQL